MKQEKVRHKENNNGCFNFSESLGFLGKILKNKVLHSISVLWKATSVHFLFYSIPFLMLPLISLKTFFCQDNLVKKKKRIILVLDWVENQKTPFFKRNSSKCI